MARLAALVFFFIGFLFIALSLKEAWFTLPVGWEIVDGEPTSTVRDAQASVYFKSAMAFAFLLWFLIAIVLFLGYGFYKAMSWSFIWAVMIFPLIWWYPQWVTVHDADTSGDAAWLQQQHDNITWLGGDVFRAHAERYNDIQLTVNMQDPPIFLAAFKTPMETITSLGIEEIPEIIWWFGLNAGFSQFVGRGWFVAWLGTGLVGLAAFGLLKGSAKKGRRQLLKRGFYVFAASASILVISAMVPVMQASASLRQAKTAALNGEYQPCIDHLMQAQKWMPSLKFDTSLIMQRGRIETLQGKNTTCAALFKVWKLENLGHGSRAKDLLADLDQKRDQLPREWQRELARAWLRVTIDDFNSGKVTTAYAQFGRICDQEPVAIQARLHHQLCALQVGDLMNNRKRRREIADLYGPYLRKDKRGVLATSWYILSQGEWNAGNAREAAEARRQSKGL